ncbi:hypothetical protein MSAN_02233300 [Mycena sanguinolenta]|uniref:Transmembrane protein n=1 Tax=Mycena sanguinolenta TaxID=230812 RepID=A0A8H7CHH6_9AGAR|nr:hypothetical protein MSAN_02233300 [Mycena sanguinolenta]
MLASARVYLAPNLRCTGAYLNDETEPFPLCFRKAINFTWGPADSRACCLFSCHSPSPMSLSLWNFTIDDTSPFLTYTPYADGSNSGLDKGWEPWYTVSGFISSNGEGGSGDSYHLTSLAGASVNLEFYGTAVYLYGTTNSSYDTTLDNATTTHNPSSSDLLLSILDLEEGHHSVTLTARPTNGSQQLAFDRAVISTPLVENQTPTMDFYDNTDTTMLKYTGDWSSATAAGIPNASVTHPWQETFASGASVEMDIGLGAVAVGVWGMANWGNWLYSVSLDGTETTCNGSTFWKVPNALLFYQGGLDPNTTHKITLTNTSPNMKLALNSMTVYNVTLVENTLAGTTSPSIPSASTSASTSATASTASAHRSVSAGVIVGPIIAVLVVGVVCGFLWWRSRRNRGSTLIPGHNMTGNRYTDQPPLVSTGYPVSSTGYSATSPSSSTAEFISPGATSTYAAPETQVFGPPGARVMTWGPGLASNPHGGDASAPSSVYSPSSNHGSPTVAHSSTYASSSDGTTSTSERQNRPLPTAVPVGKMRTPPPPPPPSAPTELDPSHVDRLVELIAQRIDRGRGQDHDESSPPEYRGY